MWKMLKKAWNVWYEWSIPKQIISAGLALFIIASLMPYRKQQPVESPPVQQESYSTTQHKPAHKTTPPKEIQKTDTSKQQTTESTKPKESSSESVDFKYKFKQDLPRITGMESVIILDTLNMSKQGGFVFVQCKATLNNQPAQIEAMYYDTGKIIQMKVNGKVIYNDTSE